MGLSTELQTLERPIAVNASSSLPTPAAADSERASTTYMRGNPTLLGALLPTPNASVANDGEGTETWLARAETLKEKHGNGNGNGAGMPLSIALQLLPTPQARDYKGAPTGWKDNPSASLPRSIGELTNPPSEGGKP